MRKSNQRGFVISIITFFVLIIMMSVAISMAVLIAYQQKGSTNAVKSTQSYYAAEAGSEDALLRSRNSPQMSSLSYSISVNGAVANVTIPNIIGGSRNITSQGNNNGIIKNIQTVYSIDSEKVSFYYGVNVGAGGLVMGNGSEVIGNVFSNGNISGTGTIDNNAIVSGNGHSIQGVYVKGDALSYSCLSPASVRNLTYVTGGAHTCTVRGTTSSQSNEISTESLPISQSQIDAWKSEATAGGTSGSITISGTQSLGPKKINGNLTLNNNATLKITGTIYVTGQITPGNNSTMKLDASYGSLGGIILSDGKIDMQNNATASGSGQAGSYLLVLSTNSANDAINLNNNVGGAIFYTSSGTVNLNDNVQVKEVTGYRVELQNNAKIVYDSGLANILFTDGPGASWKVTSWGEK